MQAQKLGTMRNPIAGILVAGLLTWTLNLAQDYRPGQLWNLNLRYNPAGALGTNWDIYGALKYRQQWKNIDGGFVTYMLEAMVPVFGDDLNKFDVGISLLQDQAGAFKTLDARLAIGYTRFLGEDIGLSVSIMGGFINRQIDAASLTWGDQFVAGLFLSQVSTSEVIGREKVGFPRVGAGISFFRSSVEDVSGMIGIFVDNLNAPDVSQLEASSSFKRFRYTGQALIGIPISDLGSYVGGGLYVWYEGGISEQAYGLQVRYNDLMDGDFHLFGAFWYRVRRTFLAGVGIGYRWVDLYYSYEFPAGKLAESFAVLPVHEITLTVQVDRGLRPETALPRF